MKTRRMLVHEHANDMRIGLFHPKNRSKGGWDHLSARELLDLMDREVEEFKAAIWAYERGGAVSRVSEEGADISNFVAMITWNLRRRQTCNAHTAKQLHDGEEKTDISHATTAASTSLTVTNP
jgi:hypothetical protein